MKDIRSFLQEGDPVSREGSVSAESSDRMWREIRSGIHSVRPAGRSAWPAFAIVLLIVCIGGVWITSRALLPGAPPQTTHAAKSSPQAQANTQVQFVTPGGTRVLWTLRPKLEAR